MGSKREDAQSNLTTPQELFCRHLISDLERGNRVRAALAAKCSPRSASATASKWLKLAKVQRRLGELGSESLVHHRITNERILAEYELIAFADPQAMYDKDGNLLSVPDMPEHMRKIIAGFDVEDRVDMSGGEPELYTVKKVKMADKKGALDSLAKWKELFPTAKKELTHKGTGPGGSIPISAEVKAIINVTVLPPGFQFPVDAKG